MNSLMFLQLLLGVVLSVFIFSEAHYLKGSGYDLDDKTKFCDYYATCNAGGVEGACVSIGSGCCQGTVTSYLCPGSDDIRCCTNNPCSTPSGSGTCKSTGQCAAEGGTSIAHYCSGPSDLQCCVKGGPAPTPSSYNADVAVSWANSYCAQDSEWLCAEFVARALHAAGEFPGLSDYGNYNGYNLRYVSQLHNCLLSLGWRQVTGSGYNCGDYGQVLIYNIDGDPDAHAALAIGGCRLDQHNPSRCGTSSNWGPNIVLGK